MAGRACGGHIRDDDVVSDPTPEPPLRVPRQERSERHRGLGAVPVLALAVLLLAWAVAGAFLAARYSRGPERPEPRASGLRGNQLPPGLDRRPAVRFDLVDARGGRIDTTELRGRPYALTFLYTQCPDVCPLIGQDLREALGALGKSSGRVAVVAISVDPRGDTPGAVQRWLSRQRLPANFRYALGSERDLKPVWEAYYAAPQVSGRPETSTHTAAVWLVDSRGRLRTRYPAGEGLSTEDMAHDLTVLMREPAGS